MAIAVGNTSGGYSSGNTRTQSHTIASGSDRVLVVSAMTQGGSVTGVTFNSVAMTLLDSQNTTAGAQFASIYYLINPPVGTYNVVVSASGASYTFAANCDYTGVDQTTPFPTTAKNYIDSTSGSPFSISLSTSVDNSWLVGSFNASIAITAVTGSILRANGDNQRKLVDSNGAKTPTGSYSIGVNIISGRMIAGVVGELAPVGAGGPSIKTINGVAKASIKSWNGVTLA